MVRYLLTELSKLRRLCLWYYRMEIEAFNLEERRKKKSISRIQNWKNEFFQYFDSKESRKSFVHDKLSNVFKYGIQKYLLLKY